MAVTFSIPSNGGSNKALNKLRSTDSQFEYGEYSPLINSVEIDWNNAVLSDANPQTGGSTSPISNTRDLLELINTMQKEIYVLTAAVIALSSR